MNFNKILIAWKGSTQFVRTLQYLNNVSYCVFTLKECALNFIIYYKLMWLCNWKEKKKNKKKSKEQKSENNVIILSQ